MSDTVRLGLVQMFCASEPEQNLDKAFALSTEAAAKGAQVICLPELFRTRYFCQKEDVAAFDLAEPIPGPGTRRLGKLARELEVVIVGSLFERRAAGLYHNTAVVLDEKGKLIGRYRKMHIPDDPLYYEKFYFTPGDLGFKSHRTHCGDLGVLICWDQWFPESARLTAIQGAQILFFPTAIGWQDGEDKAVNREQHTAWETIQRGHAIANGVYVAAVNRVGKEDQLTFWGQSFVADPFGQIVARASAEAEEVLVVDCDFSRIDEVRRNWPFLRDRRIDAYGEIEERFIDPQDAGSS